MKFQISCRWVGGLFWVLTCLAILVWSQVPRFSQYTIGWDLQVYRNAAHSLTEGHDPYVDGIAVQEEFHRTFAQHPLASPPYTYVYSPITLLLLQLAAKVPHRLCMTLYWSLYWVCLFAAIWVGWQMVEEKEKSVFALLAPVAVFFPGLLENDALFSGNVAYVVYGAVLCAALHGWRRNEWRWFYLAVLISSCFKAPFLSLLAIPVLGARKQWLPAGVVGAVGVAVFALQPHVWPSLFHHYLQAVELQFSYNRDFSASLSGLAAGAMYDMAPYKLTGAVAYIATVAGVGGVLLKLRAGFLRGEFALMQWAPLTVVGSLLLNPRIMEYDLAPITFFMLILLWRTIAWHNTDRRSWITMLVVLVCLNAMSVSMWKPIACVTSIGVFCAGAWHLWRQGSGAVSGAAQVVAG